MLPLAVPVLTNANVSEVPELVDMIIDHLHNDKASLATCSLVCKEWLPSSRYHLFSEVVLRPNFNVESFAALLDSYPTDLPSYVRSLVIELIGWDESYTWIPYLQFFVSIRSLHLSYASWDILTDESKTVLISAFQFLTSITLFRVNFTTFAELAALLSAYPLTSISLHHVRWASHNPSDTYTLPRSLRNLTLAVCEKQHILSKSLTHSSFESVDVQNVCMNDITWGEVPFIATFLNNIGPYLQELQLACKDREAESTLAHEVDLSCNTGLRCIRFKVAQLDDGRPRDVLWISTVLSKSAFCEVEMVEIIVSGYSIYFMDWDPLSSLFARKDLSHLPRLKVSVYGPVQSWAESLIRRRLSVCSARGILEVSIAP